MTRRHDASHPARVAMGLLLLLIATGCSSPTAPTRPPTTTPPTPSPDPRPLTITCPAAQTLASPTGNPVAVSYPTPTTTGGAVGAGGVSLVTVACTPSSASLFPVGTTAVRCTATAAAAAETASCTFSVTVTAPIPRLSRTRFLAFGDSMTAGEVSPAMLTRLGNDTPNYRLIVIPSASYPTQLLSRLRARYTAQTAALEVINAGRPGEWAEDGAARLPGVLSMARPEAVLLLEGLNELSALGISGVQRAIFAIDTMAKEVRNRGARLFLATLPPTRTTGPRAVPASLILSLNAQIRATARGEGAVLVDLHQALSPDVTRYIGPDGAHPTEAGYQRIADTFMLAFRASLEPQMP